MAAAAHAGGAEKALEMTRILLDAGADVGFVGPEGSALHAAAALGRGEVVSALIDVSLLCFFSRFLCVVWLCVCVFFYFDALQFMVWSFFA